MVFSNTFEEHLAHLKALFTRCASANLHLPPQKSALCRKETRYLGFIVSADGARPDRAKTDPIRRFPQPTDRKGMRRFLGICGYYRRCIRNFVRIAAPLQRLVPEDATFVWGKAKQVFEALKAALVHIAATAHPRPGLSFLIDCDAVVQGRGAVLQQRDDHKREVPTSFASCVLRANERKWFITELEAFAMMWALETFRVYVDGSPPLARADHSPLLWLRSNVDKWWVLRLQEFAFDLQQRAGRCNAVADVLSRHPVGDP